MKRKTIKGHHGQRGTCCNIGCNKPRHTVEISKSGIPTYRSDCRNCHFADIEYVNLKTGKKSVYAKGVIRVKENHCQNKFKTSKRCGDIICRTKHNPDGTLPSKQLDRDHIDGNHDYNVAKNIQTLCKSCHSEKTKLNSDHKSKGGNEFIGFDKMKKMSVLVEEFKPRKHEFFS
jgi:hypothetical protein